MSQYTREEIIKKIKKGSSLSEADLRDIDLSGADLIGADLSEAFLTSANLSGSNLMSATLKEAFLTMANLSGANLSGADLRGAVLTSANLRRANLNKSNLSGSDISGADLGDANIRNATVSDADLIRANLSGSDLTGANLRNCNLYASILNKANLTDADLTGANIWGIAKTEWIITDIKVEYVYNSGNPSASKDDKERTKRTFKPGEFGEIYKNFPKIEIVFKEHSLFDNQALIMILREINNKIPDANLDMKQLKKHLNTSVILQAGRQDLLGIILNELVEKYNSLDKAIKQLQTSQKLLLEDQQKILSQTHLATTDQNYLIEYLKEKFDNINKPQKIIIAEKVYEFIDKSAFNEYNQNKQQIDEKLEEISYSLKNIKVPNGLDKDSLSELVTKFAQELQRSNDEGKLQNIWEQLKEGIKTSSSLTYVITKIGELLGLHV